MASMSALRSVPSQAFLARKPACVPGLAGRRLSRQSVSVRAASPVVPPPSGVTVPTATPQVPPPSFGFVNWAEKINGRAAMLGFFALLLLEAVAGKGILELAGFTTGNGLGFEL